MAAVRGVCFLFRRATLPRVIYHPTFLNEASSKTFFDGRELGNRMFHVGYAQTAASKPRKNEAKKMKKPVDDVYLQDLYEPVIYDLHETVGIMKRYMELDLADEDSPVYLDIDLHLAPKGRGKHQSFWTIIDSKHKFQYSNKVCVFTESADLIKQCNEQGAYFAGGHDVIQRVLFTNARCDAYVSTEEYKKTVLDKNAELVKTMGKLAPTKKRGLNPDVVAELVKLRDGMIIHNQTLDNWHCRVVVGLIKQPLEHLEGNIFQAIESIREQQNPKHPPIVKAASISCFEETLQFEIEKDDD